MNNKNKHLNSILEQILNSHELRDRWGYDVQFRDRYYYLVILQEINTLSCYDLDADAREYLRNSLHIHILECIRTRDSYINKHELQKTFFEMIKNDQVNFSGMNAADELVEKILNVLSVEMLSDLMANHFNFIKYITSLPSKTTIIKALMNNKDFAWSAKRFDLLNSFIGSWSKYKNEQGQTILHMQVIEYSPVANDFIEDALARAPSLVNVLDAEGNSAWYYLDNFKFRSIYQFDKHKFFLAQGAKYIRNFNEEKTALHMQIGFLSQEEGLDLSHAQKHINTGDIIQGKTPLHYAIVLQKFAFAEQLIEAGASCFIKDKHQKSPIDYAILSGNVHFVKKMFAQLNIDQDFRLNPLDKGVSYIAEACYSGNMEMYKLLQELSIKTQSDEIIAYSVYWSNYGLKMLDYKSLSKLTIDQQLVVLAAISSILPKFSYKVQQYVRNYIFPSMLGSEAYQKNTFSQGLAFGVELEINAVPAATIIPLPILLDWFNAQSMHDRSAKPELLDGYNTNDYSPDGNSYTRLVLDNEIMSQILDSSPKIQLFLWLTKYLRDSGAIVNRSAGMHVHVNIRGKSDVGLPSITAAMDIGNLDSKDVELIIVKQILINWMQLEQKLQRVLRYGDLENLGEDSTHYAKPLGQLVNKLVQSKSLDELAWLISRDHALNVASLTQHGTIEFRMHEGTVEPQLLSAWLQFIHRLVKISVAQIQTQISNNLEFELQPAIDLEKLIYIFHAERKYAEVWDKKWQAPASVSITASEGMRPVHVADQNLTLYAAFKAAKAKQPYAVSLQQDVEAMLTLIEMFPVELPGLQLDNSPISTNYRSKGQCRNSRPDNYWSLELSNQALYGFDGQPLAQIDPVAVTEHQPYYYSSFICLIAIILYYLSLKVSNAPKTSQELTIIANRPV